MMSDLPESADLLIRVRQQLILAQVRIMELEDARDELAPRLAQTEALLTAAQTLADQKLDEAAHLAKVRDELAAQLQHLRHVQHVTNEALNLARDRTAAAEGAFARERQASSALKAQGEALSATVAALEARIRDSEQHLADSRLVSTRRLERMEQLDRELRALKTSRSWRWTAWLRSIERTFGRRKS
jgi:chromosome segregation ATPase